MSWRECNITPFSGATPTSLAFPYQLQCVVNQSLVLILDPQQRICHLQSLNCLAVHTGKLPPSVLTFRDRFLQPLQLLHHHAESMDFRRKRRVVEATDHSICLVLAFHPQLERFKLLSLVHRLPIVVKDGCGVQGLGVHLVTVVT